MVAKGERFERIVEGDEEDFFYSWFYGLISILIPLLLLVPDEVFLFNLILISFIDGMIFSAFVLAIIGYAESRKVYWRMLK